MALEIRPATPADADVMAAIRVASKRFAYRDFVPASYLDSEEHAAKVLAEVRADFAAARPGARGHVALSDGVPVGMTWLEHDGQPAYFDKPEGLAVLASLFVVPSTIGTGAGRTLFWRALAALEADGFSEACLLTYEPNARARGFYEAMGWRDDGYRQRHEVDWPPEPFGLVSGGYRGPTRASSVGR